LVVGKQGIRSIPLEDTTHLYDRILDSIPQVVDKLQSLMGKKEQASVTSTTYITDADEHDLEELIKRS
jgi:uncharacterized spore protein YtfJ